MDLSGHVVGIAVWLRTAAYDSSVPKTIGCSSCVE
jgi:hypothetical protein